MKWAFLTLLLLPSGARALSLERDAQLWTPMFFNAPSRGRLVGLLELQPRVQGDFERVRTAIIRPWVGWRLADATFVHAGYGWIRSDSGRVTEEHRIWQQLQHAGKPAAGWTLQARGRLEQRRLEGVGGTPWRGRLMGRVERALGGGPRYAVAYDEAFVHLNSVRRGPRSGFDQNRVFVGLGTAGERLKAEAGYQHVLLKRPGLSDSHVHCLVLNAWFWPAGR